ncbi:hypothetical protein BIW11_03333 [Tropilaelaps mercedesae]|uniref:Uncharacterized protein n=1 Tax=Tropilaelaps mercedesae TaxID=418985 RepID=A0A1V9XN54_9ACAR|nr:hypothetical protein BIW11_03333 [Tropilaelaps mercedesae]
MRTAGCALLLICALKLSSSESKTARIMSILLGPGTTICQRQRYEDIAMSIDRRP